MAVAEAVAEDVDVVVMGAGVLGRSIAYALACAEPGLRIVISGRRGPGASRAAGAMLGVLGEVTAAGLRTRHGELRLAMAVEAAARWPAWREDLRARAGGSASADGYGTGTYVLLNASSGRLDESAFEAIRTAGARHGLPVEDGAVADVPAYRPLDNDRALRALFLPREGFLDARRWLWTLDAALRALPHVRRTGTGRLRAVGDTYELITRTGRFRAHRAVVAAGSWSGAVLDGVAPDLPGLWVATGTHRDGLHASPLIAQELAAEILHGTPSPWLTPWRPDRDPIADWTAADAVKEAAAHHEALAAESRMRPPLTGDWPGLLADAYRHLMRQTYARMPDGYVLPPELAPLGYEHGPALAKLAQNHLDRLARTPRRDSA